MPGPGEYRPDVTEGTMHIDDLPKIKVACQSRNYRRRPCPRCRHGSYRDGLARRTLHDLGNPLTGRPRDIVLIDSQHYCSRCRKYFNADMTDLADPGSYYTRRDIDRVWQRIETEWAIRFQSLTRYSLVRFACGPERRTREGPTRIPPARLDTAWGSQSGGNPELGSLSAGRGHETGRQEKDADRAGLVTDSGG